MVPAIDADATDRAPSSAQPALFDRGTFRDNVGCVAMQWVDSAKVPGCQGAVLPERAEGAWRPRIADPP